MSIDDQIRHRVAALEGLQLFYLPPLLPGESAYREMYVSKEVRSVVEGPWGSSWEDQRHQAFRAVLDAFVCGYTLAVAEKPYEKSPNSEIARVDPVSDEIWDIRCIAPEARIRCLGTFGWKNCFIALTWDYRENIVNWPQEIKRCKREWQRLFHPIKRCRRKNLNDYLTRYYPA